MKKRVLMIIALIALVAVLGVVLAACNESTTNDPAGSIDYDVRQNVTLAFMILMLIAGIALIVVVMMQKGTNDNVGVISGASDTYYGRNKEKGKEGVLKKKQDAYSCGSRTGAVFILCRTEIMRTCLGAILFGAFAQPQLANMYTIGCVPPEQNHPKISCSEVRAVRHRRTVSVLFRSGISAGYVLRNASRAILKLLKKEKKRYII